MKKVFITGLILSTFVPAVAFAQTSSGGNTLPTSVGANTPPTSSGGNSQFVLQNPLNANSFCKLIQLILQGILVIGIPIAMLFLVYAGFLFIVARGSSEGLTKAKHNLVWTIVGIGLFVGAWFLGQVIAATINNLAANTGNPAINSCS